MRRYLKRNKWHFFLAGFICLLSALATLFLAYVMKYIMDVAISKDLKLFYRAIILSLLLIIIYVLLVYLKGIVNAVFLKKVMVMLRSDYFKALMNRNIFDNSNPSKYISVFNNDISLLEKNYLENLLLIISDLFLIVICTIGLFLTNFKLALIVVLINILSIIIPVIFSKQLSLKQEKYTKVLNELNIKFKDYLMGFELIKANNVINKIKTIFNTKEIEYENSKQKVRYEEAKINALSSLSSIGTNIITILLCIYFVITGRITIGTVVAINNLVNNITNPLNRLFVEIATVKGTRIVEQKIISFIDLHHCCNNDINYKESINKIQLEKVSFKYSNKLILNQIDYCFKKGKKYILVGNSGCGKTTLLKLILMYFNNYEGEILYNNKNAKDIDPTSIFDQIAFINQETFIFNDTLKNNICLFQDYDSKQINGIINKTGLNQLVASLPEGLNSKIKENGANLSGGQKQKIAIARALLKQKEIIFIDEGTSNLDNLSAYEIEKIILDSKAMIISITHHLKKELLEKYDEILVLDQGKIIESGSYNELIANQQLFYQLLCKQ